MPSIDRGGLGRAAMTAGPIGPMMVRLTWPMIFGVLSLVAFNVADTYFVAQLGTEALAAMGFTFPVVMVLGSISLGLGAGAAAVLAQAIGRGDQKSVRQTTRAALLLGVLVAGVLVVIGLLTIDPLFRALGASETTLPLIRQYMYVWYPGVIFVTVPMIGNNAIRATGDTRIPSLIMATAAAVNIVLDPILIFGKFGLPAMGITGAAVATVVARATTLTASLIVLAKVKRMLVLRDGGGILRAWARVLHIGLPAAGTNVLAPLSMGVFMRLVAQFGEPAVAAVGAGVRIEGFALTPIFALNATLTPMIGQNFGAGRLDRARRIMRNAAGFAIGWGLLSLIALVVARRPIAAAFSTEPTVGRDIALFLMIVPAGYALRGVAMLSGSAFNAVSLPMRATALNALRMFGLLVPLAWLGSIVAGYRGLLAGTALAHTTAGVIAWLWIRRTLGRLG